MTRYFTLLSAMFLALISILSPANAANIANALVDPNATGETRRLYINLKNLSTNRTNLWSNKRILFGHQNTTMQGKNFNDLSGKKLQSDVISSVGSLPAVFGFDFTADAIGGADIASYSQYQSHLKNAYAQGGIVTFTWHAKNPVTGGRFFDKSGDPVTQILSNGPARQVFLGWLDQIATFANRAGKPIIFRPLMEENASYFWWSSANATPAQLRQLWQLMVTYLRDTKGVHNLLYAFSPDAGAPNFYGATYPGNDYVDIIGGDIYGLSNFTSTIVNNVKTLVNFANSRGKVAALTEVGPRNGFSDPKASPTFYSDLITALNNDSTARKIAYMLVWRNGSSNHYWAPVQGDAAHPGFLTFHSNVATIFSNRLFDMYKPGATAIQGFPYCVSSSTTDPDGDGWGWENSKYSCIMPGGSADLSKGIAMGSHRYCTSNIPLNDSDGDGWGWQNNSSCIIPGSPPDPDANW